MPADGVSVDTGRWIRHGRPRLDRAGRDDVGGVGGKLHGGDRMLAGTPSRRPPACKEANREGIGDLGFERCGGYRFTGGWRGGCGGDGIPHDGGD